MATAPKKKTGAKKKPGTKKAASGKKPAKKSTTKSIEDKIAAQDKKREAVSRAAKKTCLTSAPMEQISGIA